MTGPREHVGARKRGESVAIAAHILTRLSKREREQCAVRIGPGTHGPVIQTPPQFGQLRLPTGAAVVGRALELVEQLAEDGPCIACESDLGRNVPAELARIRIDVHDRGR